MVQKQDVCQIHLKTGLFFWFSKAIMFLGASENWSGFQITI
jgi:hypothetical protein